MILFSPSFLFSPLACALRSLVYFPSQMCGDGADVGWELCWDPRVPVVWSVCWSRVVLGACLRCHFCGVGVGRCFVFVRLRVVHGLFFLSYCGVSSDVRDWSCVVELCACRHLFLSFVPLLSFVSLSPPSWWTISVVYFVSLLERGRIGRGLLSRRLVRHRRWYPQR